MIYLSDSGRVFAKYSEIIPEIVGDPANQGRVFVSPDETEIGSFLPSSAIPYVNVQTLLGYSATRRWEIIENGSIEIGDFQVPTDSMTQLVLTAAFIKATSNPEYTVSPWKIGPGQYTVLSADTIIFIANSVEEYIQTMFAKNETVDIAILAGEITTFEEINQAYA